MVQFNYNGLSKSGGIYIIFNSYNWRIYVGSTKHFFKRWKDGHVKTLLNGKHSNKFLLSDFNKCRELLGNDDFLEFHIIKDMPGSTREERLLEEEIYIKAHFDQGKNCYNLCDRAISREGYKSKDPKETKQLLSDKSLKMWKNPEFRKKRAESMTKYFETKEAKDTCKRRSINIWSNTETRKKYGEKISNKWKEPEFRERRLNQKKSKENVENFKKNCHTKDANAKTALANTKNHGKIQSPEGEIFEVIGLKTFCLEHDIPLSSLGNLSKVLKGQVKSIFGWKLVSL